MRLPIGDKTLKVDLSNESCGGIRGGGGGGEIILNFNACGTQCVSKNENDSEDVSESKSEN